MLPMLDESKLAYQLALEVAKQLITISTAIITLSVTLGKDVFKQSPGVAARFILAGALTCYLLSIWYGIGHIQSLTGSLEMSAIQRAAVPDSGVATQAARAFLDSASDSAAIARAREHLSDLGVTIGSSAKYDASRQIQFFLWGTVLVVGYVATLLFSRTRPVPAPEAPGPKAGPPD